MPISMENLTLGEVYNRDYLAQLWGYRDRHPLQRGVVTPANDNKIVLFITGEKESSATQYSDYFDGNVLHIDGETNHANDRRIVEAAKHGDELYLFYRDRHHRPFTYFGRVRLLDYVLRDGGTPSRFSFETERSWVLAETALLTEQIAHGTADDNFAPDIEGRKRLRLHYTYERSKKNRARAIELHGTRCSACDFDFDVFYGPELAGSYIEIHHIGGLSDEERTVDPATDLAPLCSNCHSMVHRLGHGAILSLDDLRLLITKRKRARGR